MEMVKKKAFDPSTGEVYEVEMPAPKEVRKGILELEFPPEGIQVKEAVAQLADKFQLSDEQRNAKYKSGSKVFYINVVRREFRRLLDDGTLAQPGGSRTPYVLSDPPPQTLISGISSIPDSSVTIEVGERTGPTAEASIEENYQQIQGALAADLLQRIKDNTPAFFEELVIDLLVAMGYGGSREDAEAVGRSGDGGIDGIINEDVLGLDVIYVQAKRWQADVGEPPVRDFVGALQGRRARKGIFITTSAFANGAKKYVSEVDTKDTKIVLIDGRQLAQFMIDNNVGVSVVKSYEIKRVDSDYFAEEGE